MRLETTTRSAPERRRFIGLVGGGAVLAAVPWASGCASGGADGPAEPAAEETDVRRFMLAHALLAPNPHNRQPWLADLSRDSEIVLECDAGRLLPETDPFGRQIVVGCGAFVELAVIAAAERGVRVAVQVFPSGEPAANELPGGRVVARLVLSRDPSVARDPLFAQIQRRHTNKGAYDTGRDVPAAQWQRYASGAQALGLMSGSVTDAARMASVRAVTRAAYEIESVTPRTWLESARLLRIGPSEIAEHRDGIPVTSTMARLVTALGLFDRYDVPVRGSSNYARVMDRWAPFETGSGYLWIASRGNGRRAQFDTGRAYVRAHLQATAEGVDMHPLSQALQEFAEVRAQHREMHRLLGFEPEEATLQMLARVGYGTSAAAPSPRRGLAPLLKT